LGFSSANAIEIPISRLCRKGAVRLEFLCRAFHIEPELLKAELSQATLAIIGTDMKDHSRENTENPYSLLTCIVLLLADVVATQLKIYPLF